MHDEIEKLKYHVKLLSDCLPIDDESYARLAIARDWGPKDFDRAHDIFERYDKQLRDGAKLNGSALEHDLREAFIIGYQEVKGIVITFWHGGQWQEVCRQYAEQNKCMEFHGILGP
jgi:hypothetical protein